MLSFLKKFKKLFLHSNRPVICHDIRVQSIGCRVVQLGRKSDPSLDADMDLRDKISPRLAAAVLASCKLLVCQEGCHI